MNCSKCNGSDGVGYFAIAGYINGSLLSDCKPAYFCVACKAEMEDKDGKPWDALIFKLTPTTPEYETRPRKAFDLRAGRTNEEWDRGNEGSRNLNE